MVHHFPLKQEKEQKHVEAVLIFPFLSVFFFLWGMCHFLLQKGEIGVFPNDTWVIMDIDYKNEILYGRLQRMAPRSAEIGPALKDYWVVSIDPKNSPKILNLIKTQFQYTSESLRHLKRMFKVKDQQGSDKLKVLICPVEDSYTTFDELKLLLETTLQQETDVPIEKCKIPMNKPLDKEMNIQWTNMYWPLLWKGNPLIQDLNEIYKQIDISKVDKYMKLVADLSKKGVRIIFISVLFFYFFFTITDKY